MGNYVFDAEVLIDAVHRDGARPDSNHDMGGDIIPDFVARGEAGVYDLNRNDVPGSTDRDRFYWRDVGTIESFFEAHQDLISALPIFNLYNRDWPIYQPAAQLAAREVRARREEGDRHGDRLDRVARLRRLGRAPRALASSDRGRSVQSGAKVDRLGGLRAGRRSARTPSCSALSSTRTSSSMPGPRSASTMTRIARAASPSPRPASRSSARACTSRSSPLARKAPTPHGALPRGARRRLDAHRRRGDRAARGRGGLGRAGRRDHDPRDERRDGLRGVPARAGRDSGGTPGLRPRQACEHGSPSRAGSRADRGRSGCRRCRRRRCPAASTR